MVKRLHSSVKDVLCSNIATVDVFYITSRGSLNLFIYPTMQRLGLYITDAEAVSAISTKHPSIFNIKSDIFAWLKN